MKRIFCFLLFGLSFLAVFGQSDASFRYLTVERLRFKPTPADYFNRALTNSTLAGATNFDIPSALAVKSYADGRLFGSPKLAGSPAVGDVPRWDGTFWYFSPMGGGGGGGGSVFNFSAGSLANLFTTSVANPTTSPALSFTPVFGTSGQLFRTNVAGTATEWFTSPYLTANQAITLSGDVIGSGTTAISTSFRNSASLSVIGRSANTTGAPADIVAGSDGHVLRRFGGVLGFGTLGSASFGGAGTSGQVLTADGSGGAAWTASSGGGSSFYQTWRLGGTPQTQRGFVNFLVGSGAGNIVPSMNDDGVNDETEVALTLATSGVASGSYANASVTFNNKGVATSASNGAYYQMSKNNGAAVTSRPRLDWTDGALTWTFTDDFLGGRTTVEHALSNNAVTSPAQLSDDVVTNAKLANMSQFRVKGRASSGSGDPEDIAADAGMVMRRSEDGTQFGFGTVPPSGFADGTISLDRFAQTGALDGQIPKWSTALGKYAPANDNTGGGGGSGLPAGAPSNTIRYDASSVGVAATNLLNDGTNISVSGAVDASFKAKFYGPTRTEGVGQFRGVGTDMLGSNAVAAARFLNTANASHIWSVGVPDGGDFKVENASATAMSATFSGDVTIPNKLTVGTMGAGAPVGLLSKDVGGQLVPVTLGTNLSFSGNTLNATAGGGDNFANADLNAVAARSHLMLDNTVNALRIGATGAPALLAMHTTNGAEAVAINGYIDPLKVKLGRGSGQAQAVMRLTTTAQPVISAEEDRALLFVLNKSGSTRTLNAQAGTTIKGGPAYLLPNDECVGLQFNSGTLDWERISNTVEGAGGGGSWLDVPSTSTFTTTTPFTTPLTVPAPTPVTTLETPVLLAGTYVIECVMYIEMYDLLLSGVGGRTSAGGGKFEAQMSSGAGIFEMDVIYPLTSGGSQASRDMTAAGTHGSAVTTTFPTEFRASVAGRLVVSSAGVFRPVVYVESSTSTATYQMRVLAGSYIRYRAV